MNYLNFYDFEENKSKIAVIEMLQILDIFCKRLHIVAAVREKREMSGKKKVRKIQSW